MGELTVSEALEGLATDEVWGEYLEAWRATGNTADRLAPRIRAALRAYGDYQESEVRRALAERLGMQESMESDVAIEGSAPDVPEADPRGSAAEEAAPPKASAEAADDRYAERAASRALYRLYDDGVRLEIDGDGNLLADRDGGLNGDHRKILWEHEDGLKRLLSEEAMSAIWPEAVRYVSDTFRRRGCAPGGAESERAAELLNEAQTAYEAHDDGLTRYQLRRAALAASGRLSGRSGGGAAE